MVEQQDALQHNGMIGRETETYVGNIAEVFVKTTWKQLPLKMESTLQV